MTEMPFDLKLWLESESSCPNCGCDSVLEDPTNSEYWWCKTCGFTVKKDGSKVIYHGDPPMQNPTPTTVKEEFLNLSIKDYLDLKQLFPEMTDKVYPEIAKMMKKDVNEK
jgi:ribosomal protein S27AE